MPGKVKGPFVEIEEKGDARLQLAFKTMNERLAVHRDKANCYVPSVNQACSKFLSTQSQACFHSLSLALYC